VPYGGNYSERVDFLYVILPLLFCSCSVTRRPKKCIDYGIVRELLSLGLSCTRIRMSVDKRCIGILKEKRFWPDIQQYQTKTC